MKSSASLGTVEATVEWAQENHPEVSFDVVSPAGEKAPEVEVVGPMEGDRKRHREGSSTRSHHKKSKSIVVSESGAHLPGKDLLTDDAGVAAAVVPNSAIVKMCRTYAENVCLTSPETLWFSVRDFCRIHFLSMFCFVWQLVHELEKLTLVDEEISKKNRLKQELKELSFPKAKVERREANLIQEKWSVAGKNLKLLVDRSVLITECDSLSAAVKGFEIRVAELEQGLAEKTDLSKALEEECGKTQLELDTVK